MLRKRFMVNNLLSVALFVLTLSPRVQGGEAEGGGAGVDPSSFRVLIFSDFIDDLSTGNLAADACTDLGLTFQVVNAQRDFSDALERSFWNLVVIVQEAASGIELRFGEVAQYLDGGGTLILMTFNLDRTFDTPLAQSMGLKLSTDLEDPVALDWTGVDPSLNYVDVEVQVSSNLFSGTILMSNQ